MCSDSRDQSIPYAYANKGPTAFKLLASSAIFSINLFLPALTIRPIPMLQHYAGVGTSTTNQDGALACLAPRNCPFNMPNYLAAD